MKYQKQQRDQEAKRTKLRRELYERQDAVEAQRNELIAELEGKLGQNASNTNIFAINWQLI